MKNSLKSRRSALKLVLLTSGLVGTSELGKPWAKPWIKPVVEGIVLPSHGQMTPETPEEPDQPEQPAGPTISCSGTTIDGPIAEGEVALTDVTITVSTTPPQPNALITINGLCDGNVVSTAPNNLLDQNGQFVLTFGSDICSSPAPFSNSFGARFTLQSNNAVTECNYLRTIA